MKTILSIFLLSVTTCLSAQTYDISNYHCDSLLVSLTEDENVTNTYNVTELTKYYIEEPEHLIKIDIVQNHSYRFSIDDPNLLSNGRQNQFINSFDVRKYERKRKKDERTIIVFEKYGITLELLSIDELTSLINTKTQQGQNVTLTSFPNDTGQSAYTSKKDWALNHPQLAQILNL